MRSSAPASNSSNGGGFQVEESKALRHRLPRGLAEKQFDTVCRNAQSLFGDDSRVWNSMKQIEEDIAIVGACRRDTLPQWKESLDMATFQDQQLASCARVDAALQELTVSGPALSLGASEVEPQTESPLKRVQQCTQKPPVSVNLQS